MGGAGASSQKNNDLLSYQWNLVNATRLSDNTIRLNNGVNASASLGEPMDLTKYNMLNVTVYPYTTNNFSYYYSVEISTDGASWTSISGTRESPTTTGGRTDLIQYDVSSRTGNYYLRVRTWAGNATSTLTIVSAFLG